MGPRESVSPSFSLSAPAPGPPTGTPLGAKIDLLITTLFAATVEIIVYFFSFRLFVNYNSREKKKN